MVELEQPVNEQPNDRRWITFGMPAFLLLLAAAMFLAVQSETPGMEVLVSLTGLPMMIVINRLIYMDIARMNRNIARLKRDERRLEWQMRSEAKQMLADTDRQQENDHSEKR